mgnify:CR=1 FL=1
MTSSSRRILFHFLLAVVLPAVCSAVTFNTRNYFLNTTKGLGKPTSCVAAVKNNTGTYARTFAYSAAHCPGVELFIWTKGAPPWAEEHFYDAGSYIKLLDDLNSDPGRLDFAQVLFEVPGEHGLNVFKDGNVSNSYFMPHANTYTQYWGGNTCPSTPGQVNGPFSGFDENVWVGTVTNWLWDCRAGRPCQNGTKYPIEVFQRNGSFVETGVEDHSWWARWQDPMDGNQWRGLGPVKFWCSPAGVGYCPSNGAASESHYLVDCQTTPTCYTCP